MNPENSYDLIIVGAGPTGLVASLYAQRLGMNHLLIEKNIFPKDKICGDGLAPLVFKILNELNIVPETSDGFYKVSEIEFKFSDKDTSASFIGGSQAETGTYNCKRIVFDELLKNKENTERFIFYADVKEVNESDNFITCSSVGQKKQIHFKNLLLCTGSGRNLLPVAKNNELTNISFASRAYIEVENAGHKDLFEFFDEIAPGYFWAFPVSATTLNTGVYLHEKNFVTELYEIHERKLRQYFPKTNSINFKRWPLKIYPNPEKSNHKNIVAIGDANYSIDPILGHGIDVGMLQAREQILSLKRTGNFLTESSIYNEIEKLGKASVKYKSILSTTLAPEIRKTEFQKYLRELSRFYSAVNNYLQKQPLRFDNLEIEKLNAGSSPMRHRNTTFGLQNKLSDEGYAVIDFLGSDEFSEIEKILSQFQFGFTNNRNREKLKFNSSFFESDTELKIRYYKKMVAFFQPKIDLLLEDYDILITNLWEKKPGDDEVLVHQNWTHVDEKHFRSYSIWIPLQNTNEVNGTMEVIPRSHKLFSPLRGINMEYPFSHPFKAIGKEIKKEFLVPVNILKGQAIIFDDALIHYTGPNNSENTRVAIQLIIKPKSAKGLFYYKHKEITNGNNVEVFEADPDFYIRLKLITGGNTRPEHGASRGFIYHTSKDISMEDFRNTMNSQKPVDTETITTFPKENFIKKISSAVKNVLSRV